MALPDKCVEEFRQLWKQIAGEDLDIEAARQQAERLLTVLGYAFNRSGRDPPH